MITNLKLINPQKENELFSVHKSKKNNPPDFLSQYFLNKTYKSFGIQKNSLTSLKKEVKSDKKNKTYYSFKNNKIYHIPYPSFPKNNKIPSSYKNINKNLKYPKISNNKYNLYNTYNNFNKNNKVILLSNNSKTRLNSESNKILNNKNKIINSINNGIISLNNYFNSPNQLKNKNIIKQKIFNIESYTNKKVKKKQNVNTNNFSNILDNILHLIELRDQHNNSLIYTKVANLLLDEKNKLLQSLQKKEKRKKSNKKDYSEKREISSAFKKEELVARKLKLDYESANTLIYERTRRRLNSFKLKKNYNLKLLIKYRLFLNKNIYVNRRPRKGSLNVDNYRDKDKEKDKDKNKDKRSMHSTKNLNNFSLSKSLSFDSFRDSENSNVKKYDDNDYELVYEENSDRLYKTRRYNYLKKKNIISNDSKTNNNKIYNSLKNINNFRNNNSNINNDNNMNDNLYNKEKSHLFKLLNNNNNNNNIRKGIYSYYNKDNKEIKDNKSNNNQNQEKLPLSNILDNINKLNSVPLFEKNKNILDQQYKNANMDIPIFEQMVNNDKLIRLIHEYVDEENNNIDNKDIEDNEGNLEMDEKTKGKKNEYIRKKGDIYDLIKKGKIKGYNINKVKYKIGKNKIFEKYNDIYKLKNKFNNIQDYISKDNKFIINNNNNIFDNDDDDNNFFNNIINNKEFNLYNKSFSSKNLYRVKIEKVVRKERRAKTFIMKKIELGFEIIKHICQEIRIDKNEQDNIEGLFFNLIKISRKEKASDKEEIFLKKMLIPMDEIMKEYLKNMRKINSLNRKPKYLFDKSLKKLLKKKLKELEDIGAEGYYIEENEEEKKEKEKEKEKKTIEINDYKNIKEEEEKKERIKYKYLLKSLIFDHSYFFKNKLKEKIINPLQNSVKIKDETTRQEDSLKKSIIDTSNSFEFNNEFGRKSSVNFRSTKNSKFIKTKKAIGLKIIQDEYDENYLNKKNILTEENDEKLKNEEILDKKLHAFFKKINQLKNIKNNDDEEKLKMFIDQEMEKFSYGNERKIEDRKYNFFKDLKMARINAKNEKQFSNNKLQFLSPIIFYNYNNNNN